ncbi:MAG: SufS family cysteine desulfurase [Lachnospiraceae bacterium]|nr:SufS family cysteine desulfurase [Lachnospiraceae bacterium]
MNIDKIRNDFPIFKTTGRAYLDSAATSQKPECVIKAEESFYKESNANTLRGFYPLSVKATEIYEDARKTVASFIGTDKSEEIIFTRNATESLNLIAYSYGMTNINEGDEIVVSIAEHHSNILPWQMIAQSKGAVLKYLECKQDGSFSDEDIEKAISEKTKLVAFTHVSNVLGRINPIEKVISLVHKAGAVAVIDASQSIQHTKIDVKKTNVDFLVFSGHKMLGPMGIGVLYGKKEILDKMPPFLTGGEMIESVRRDSATYAKLPHKFEAGTVNAAGAAGLAAAIGYLEETGLDKIHARDRELTQRAIEGLKKIKHVHVLGSDDYREHNGIISFTVDDVHPHDVSEVLSADGIDVRAGHHCAQPLLEHLKVRNATRASIMFYNTEDEIDRFVSSVANVRVRMGFAD